MMFLVVLCLMSTASAGSRKLPGKTFKLRPILTPELMHLEDFFANDDIVKIFSENTTYHPIFDRLNEFSSNPEIKPKLRTQFGLAIKEYAKLNSLTRMEKETIVYSRHMLGEIASLLERLPVNHAVRASQLIPSIDLSPLQHNQVDQLLSPQAIYEKKTIWQKLIDEEDEVVV